MKVIVKSLSMLLLFAMLLTAIAPCISAQTDIVTVNPTLNTATIDRVYSSESSTKYSSNDEKLEALLPIYESLREEIKSASSSSSYYFGTPSDNIGTPKSEWDAELPTITESHPRLLLTKDTIPTIRKSLEEDNPTNNRFFELLDADPATTINNGKLKTMAEVGDNFDGRNGKHNYDKSYLEFIQVKALGYLVDGHELYGYQAIHCMKQFLRTLDIQYITSNMEREYGNTMFTAALVYDWCYDLLTAEDKKQLMAGIENRTASGMCGDPSYTTTTHYKWKMSVGFPPYAEKNVGAVSGHGSERQVLRDYLSVAIAFYGDNNSWWNYIGKLVYSEYVPVRNYYFQSGISQQGVGVYVSGRHISDMYSAWMLKTATGSQPYDNIDKTIRNFLGYECAPGKLYSDGDGSGSIQNNYEFRALSYMTAYIFADEPMLAQAKDMQPTKAFGSDTIELTSAMFVALTGMSDIEPAADKYEGMKLIQYNGSPVGQYVIHEAWNDPNSASAFMKIKERTTANHEHADAGNFMIYYKGMLTADGGVYNGYAGDHTRYYHQASVSHNTLLIYNADTSALEDSTSNPNIARKSEWYSGGQIWPAEAGTLTDLKGNKYLTGKVIGKGHGYNDSAQTDPKYAYIGGNITNAYPEDTVDFVGRRMLTVYTGDEDVPMVFFVYDRITSDKSSYQKTFLLHITSSEEPTINQTNKTVATENGDGRLVLTCLTSDATIKGVGGRSYGTDGKYVAATSQNYMTNGKQNATTNNYDVGSWGRIEIAMSTTTTSSLLNSIYVTDKGNTTYYKTVPITNVSTGLFTNSAEDIEGCVFNNSIAAIFTKRNLSASDKYITGKISFTTSGNSSMSYYVDGLEGGNWNITVDGKSYGSAKSSSGILTFDAPAGDVVLTKESADTASKRTELTEALGNKISNSNGYYTSASYAAYSEAYDAILNSINTAEDVTALNAINVASLKTSAEAKLESSLAEVRAELIAQLGNKKAFNATLYTQSSYDDYSNAFDGILTVINDANTVAELNEINVPNLKKAAEALLKAPSSGGNTEVATPENSVETDVLVNYGESLDSGSTVYSIDVVWTDLTFEYSAGSSQWNPQSHDYSTTVDGASWTDSSGTITITNHSNIGIMGTITFSKASTPNGSASLTVEGSQFSLDSAESTTYTNAPKFTAKITASGTPNNKGTVGTITIRMEKFN